MTLLVQLADLKPLGYQQYTPTASTGLSPPSGASLAVITVTGQSVRYRDDGSAPDATHGVLLPVGLAPFFYMGDLNAVRFIQTSASAVMDVNFYETN